jgi:hypothetical protein
MAAIAAIAAFKVAGNVLDAKQKSSSNKAQAKLFNEKADAERANTAFELQQTKKLFDQRRSSIRSEFSSSGILNTGSALNFEKATEKEQELDLLNIKYNGEIRARQATQQAKEYKKQAKYDILGGAFGVGKSIAGGFL